MHNYGYCTDNHELPTPNIKLCSIIGAHCRRLWKQLPASERRAWAEHAEEERERWEGYRKSARMADRLAAKLSAVLVLAATPKG